MSDEKAPIVEEVRGVDGLPTRAAIEAALTGTHCQGSIAISGEAKGSYYGCRAIEFDNADAMNAFFNKLEGVVQVTNVYYSGTRILCLYMNSMTQQEINDHKEVWAEINVGLAKRRRDRAGEMLKEEQAATAAQAEQDRLAKLGKHAEEHWKPVIELLRKKGSKGGGKEEREAMAQKLLEAADEAQSD